MRRIDNIDKYKDIFYRSSELCDKKTPIHSKSQPKARKLCKCELSDILEFMGEQDIEYEYL